MQQCSAVQCSAHNGCHSLSCKFWLKFIFSAHMNTMELLFVGGLHKMCMCWATIFLHIFSGAPKSHCPVPSRALPGLARLDKVNCSYLNFTTTSRKHFDPLNPPFGHKSLPKSEKKN